LLDDTLKSLDAQIGCLSEKTSVSKEIDEISALKSVTISPQQMQVNKNRSLEESFRLQAEAADNSSQATDVELQTETKIETSGIQMSDSQPLKMTTLSQQVTNTTISDKKAATNATLVTLSGSKAEGLKKPANVLVSMAKACEPILKSFDDVLVGPPMQPLTCFWDSLI
jgi:hypothetical protein